MRKSTRETVEPDAETQDGAIETQDSATETAGDATEPQDTATETQDAGTVPTATADADAPETEGESTAAATRGRRGAAAEGAADRRAAKRSKRKGTSAGGARKAGDSAAAASATGADRSATPRKPVTAARLKQVIAALLVVAVLLLVALVVQLIKGSGNGGKVAAREDRGEAARQAANTEIPKLYSYDYRQIDQNITEQQQLTVGGINDQIRNQTAPALKQLAPKAKAVVQAVSLDSAVLDNSGQDVQVLVYLNQAVSSNLLPAPRLDRNRVVATMRLVNGQWKVADIKAL